jgi:hypothetical protein
VVQEVEEIGAGLQGEAFVEAELAAEGQVGLGGAEAAEGVSSEIALDGSRGDGEGGGVDLLSAGYVGIVEPERDSGNQIRALNAGGS